MDEAKRLGIKAKLLAAPLASQKVTAKRLVSYRVAANLSGQYLRNEVADTKAIVAAFPGPAGSGWAEDMFDGFNEAIAGRSNITVVDKKWGDTGKDVQINLLQNVLQAHPDVTYIVGNPVAADAAVNVLDQLGYGKKVKIVSFIANSPVWRLMRRLTSWRDAKSIFRLAPGSATSPRKMWVHSYGRAPSLPTDTARHSR
jgi:periplasmic protein TorT